MRPLTIRQTIFLIFYYAICQYLPTSYKPYGGKIARRLRYWCGKNIFLKCGKNINIERKAHFGVGKNICIGDNSGIGVNCVVPDNIVIGSNVMMGPECYFFKQNHCFDNIDIPMNLQGYSAAKITIIEDDVWLGRGIMVTPGRIIKKGSVIGAGTLLCKDFPEYSVVGGNPSKFIKSRLIKK